MRKLLSVLLIVASLSSFAQDYKVPVYKFGNATDYSKYNAEIIKCITWIESNPSDIESKNAATQFFVEWLTGTPDVSVEMSSAILKFNQENSDLLMAFMFGWTKYALQTPGAVEDKIKLNAAALRNVIRVYKKTSDRDPEIDKLATLDKEGKLETWVKDQLKIK
ncbi:MAG: hypothetical protein CFE23_07680 [Flavobacterium sp. BFFFF1]|uniref:hypothetical protein n=1 Tax=Flavobacterium sp. BFFFF1 TaxID=2015557 RepID=UPI000BD1425A|nr:hypothetical protein [Flavobacterium sp. BFFFF1]OYU80836.1 MAG: hypothetical protein CFE23_07680 [Flavobacterium sp. BFFFF1]